MKNLYKILFPCSMLLLIPAAANAAGTYYTGGYQSPQQSRYTQKSYAMPRMNNYASTQGVSQYTQKQYANAGYNTNLARTRNVQQPVSQSATPQSNTTRNGLHLNAGISKQVAMWQFEMNTAQSKLHYDNIDWLTFDVGGKYVFDAGKTKMQIDAGFLYGIQTGESSMVDDDISHGGYLIGSFTDSKTNATIGGQYGHALSTSTSDGGSMMGFNAGFGLTDFMKVGKLKITPSIGWRYLKYELESKNTHGMVMSTFDFNNSCYTSPDGQTDCVPAVVFFNTSIDPNTNKIVISDLSYSDYIADLNQDGLVDNIGFKDVTNLDYVDVPNTFYFAQSGVSHSYEVEWSGPYLALDMLYDINVNNAVNARVEFGLPSYTATGDQPYRYDWQHPKSVEDKGGFGSAFHFGAGANWMTKITDSISLSIGVTYDYYTVSDADATTYLDPTYAQASLDTIFEKWQKLFPDSTATEVEQYMLNGVIIEDVPQEDGTFKDVEIYADPNAVALNEAKQKGWALETDSEIESFYKSLGVRIGINAKF